MEQTSRRADEQTRIIFLPLERGGGARSATEGVES